LARKKGGARAPSFFYLEKGYFKVMEHPSEKGRWLIVNMNGALLSDNELPMTHDGPNGNIVDALGCDTFTCFHYKEGADRKANALNDRVISGWSDDFEVEPKWKVAYDKLKDYVGFWALIGACLTGTIISVMWWFGFITK
jgi:hypothetical protein